VSFFAEIKRRKVFRVAAVYAVVGWLIIQVVSAVAEPLQLPDWLDTVTIVLLLAGFPIAVILAWAFDITPGGIVATPPATAADSSAQAGLRFSYVIQSLVLLAVGFLVVDQYLLDRPSADPSRMPRSDLQGQVNRFDLALPEGRSIRGAAAGAIAISPDGRRFVFNTDAGLYLRSMESLEARLIPGTEEPAWGPAFAPDGESVVFATDDGQTRIALDGRVRITIADSGDLDQRSSPRAAADGSVLYYEYGRGILRATDAGSEPALVLDIPEEYEAFGPVLLPAGDAVLFSMAPRGANSWNMSRIVLQTLSTGERRILVENGSDARYVPTGHLVYRADDVLYGIAFDLDTYTVSGKPVALAQDVMGPGLGDDYAAANFDVSREGTLVYITGTARGRARSTLTWVDRTGNEEPLGFEPRVFAYPRLSPDGSRIAFAIREDAGQVWVGDLTRRSMSRLSEDAGLSPVWSPDGTRVFFGGNRAILSRRSDGSAAAEELVRVGENELPNVFQYPRSISGDGQILFTSSADPPRDIGSLRIGADRTEPLIVAPGEQVSAELSPDGRWLAYDSSESGRSEIYVRPFPNVGERRIQISTDGGADPVFSRDGTELFYWSEPGTIMSVAIEAGANGEFVVDVPRVAVSGDYVKGNAARQYDVASDGERFVVLKRADAVGADELERARIVIVQNWFDELRRLVPAEQ